MSTERGIAVVEILIGLVVGLIGAVAMFQVMSSAEGYRRTNVAGSDSQVSGAVSLFALERDVIQAGFNAGRLAATWAGCPVAVNHPQAAYSGTFDLRPVRIVQGSLSTPSDRIVALVGSSPVHVDPVEVASLDSASVGLVLRRRAGFFAGDLLIGGMAGGCALARVAALGGDPRTILIGTGSFNASALPAAIPAGGAVVNLGQSPRLVEWYVDQGRLMSVNRLAAAPQPQPIGDGVIELQAQYGVDANGNAVIDPPEWQDAEPASAVQWRGMLAIRVGVLVRSDSLERDIVTVAPPQWDGGAFTPLASVGGDWQRYRYRVYQTTATLRNVLWGRP